MSACLGFRFLVFRCRDFFQDKKPTVFGHVIDALDRAEKGGGIHLLIVHGVSSCHPTSHAFRSGCGCSRSRWRSNLTRCTCSPRDRGGACASGNGCSPNRRTRNRTIRNASRRHDARACASDCECSPNHSSLNHNTYTLSPYLHFLSDFKTLRTIVSIASITKLRTIDAAINQVDSPQCENKLRFVRLPLPLRRMFPPKAATFALHDPESDCLRLASAKPNVVCGAGMRRRSLLQRVAVGRARASIIGVYQPNLLPYL